MGGAMGFVALALLRKGPGLGFDLFPLMLCHTVVSVVLLFIRMPAVQHKLAWAIVTISIASALDQQALVDSKRPLKVMLSALIGVASSLIVNFLPWPMSRAHQRGDALVLKARRSCGRAISCLSRVLSLAGASCAPSRDGAMAVTAGSLMAEAERCLGDAERACDEASRIIADIGWEAVDYADGVVKSIERARLLTAAVGGMWLASSSMMDQQDGLGGDAAIGISSLRAWELESVAEEGGDEGEGNGAGAVEEMKGVMWLKELLEEKTTKDELFDTWLGGPVQTVGMLVESCLSAEEESIDRASCESKLVEAEKSLDDAVFKVRETLYYSGERGGMADVCYKAFGPPMDRFCLLFCLKECSRLARIPRGQRREKRAHILSRLLCDAMAEAKNWKLGCEWAWQDMFGLWSRISSTLSTGMCNLDDVAASRGTYAAKLTLANLVAMHIGILMTGSGLWAAVAVCFIGPRDSTRAGGGLRTGMLRVVGTVFGSMWGYTAAFLTQAQSQLGFWHLTVLSMWVFASGFPRANPGTAYGAQVSQFTPYIMVEVPTASSVAASVLADGIPYGFSSWAWRRIQQNIIAVVVFMAIELTVLPTLSSALLLREFVLNLRQNAATTTAIFLAHTSSLCPACHETAPAESIQKMEAGLKKQREYLEEARDETHWSRKGAGQERVRSSEALIDIQGMQLGRLLTLMQAVINLWARWEDAEGKLARILQPTRSAFLKLKVSSGAI